MTNEKALERHKYIPTQLYENSPCAWADHPDAIGDAQYYCGLPPNAAIHLSDDVAGDKFIPFAEDSMTTTKPQSIEEPPESHPEDSCHKCRRPNVVWFTPNVLWNRVVRAFGETEILCPLCFVQLARAAGVDPVWEVAPEGWHDEQTQNSVAEAFHVIDKTLTASLTTPSASHAAAEEIRDWIGISGLVDGQGLNEVAAIIDRYLAAAKASQGETERHYFCSCGGALTAEEYITHYFEMDHDRGDPAVPASAAPVVDSNAGLPIWNGTWPLFDVLTRLADAVDHLLQDHDCDMHGYEGLSFAIPAARWYAALVAAATAAPVEQSDSLLAKITQIADIGSAEEFGDAIERLRAIRKLIVTTNEGAR